MFCSEDRIIAQATAQGSGQRGVIRISGPDVLTAISFGSKENRIPFFEAEGSEFFSDPVSSNGGTCWQNNDDIRFDRPVNFGGGQISKIIAGRIHPWPSPGDRLSVPCEIYYWSQGGFTGEPALELHLPGAQPVLDAVIRRICQVGLARMADRGEFTLRAFLSGRIDLTQAEAVLGVIDAEDQSGLSSALKQLAGGLEKPLDQLREMLIAAAADLEAGLDFTEEDIEFISRERLQNQLQAAIETIRGIENKMTRRGAPEDRPSVVLWGLPNSGKSSLFNAIVRDRSESDLQEALVSSVAGTTRDYLEYPVCAQGISWRLIDTAGIKTDSCQDSLSFKEIDPSKENSSSLKKNVIQNENSLKEEIRQDENDPERKSFAATQSAVNRARLILLCVDVQRCLDTSRRTDRYQENIIDQKKDVYQNSKVTQDSAFSKMKETHQEICFSQTSDEFKEVDVHRDVNVFPCPQEKILLEQNAKNIVIVFTKTDLVPDKTKQTIALSSKDKIETAKKTLDKKNEIKYNEVEYRNAKNGQTDIVDEKKFIKNKNYFDRLEERIKVFFADRRELPDFVKTSAKDHLGIQEILRTVSRRLTEDHLESEVVPATAVRCRNSLRQALVSLQEALKLTEITQDDVLIAAELRAALDQLGLITGAVHTDDILDRIFSKFCIGK